MLDTHLRTSASGVPRRAPGLPLRKPTGAGKSRELIDAGSGAASRTCNDPFNLQADAAAGQLP